MSEAIFRLEGIEAGYGDGPAVLRGLDLQVRRGDRVAITGPNGAGKSTLLHLMVGLIRPRTGSVWAFGRQRNGERDFHDVRLRAGLLFQQADDQLFSPTVFDDVAFGPLNQGKDPTEVRDLVLATLDDLGLAGYERRLTHMLSGGEKRLVSLATVLAMRPDVLLLDEPLAGLDQPTEARLVELLGRMPQALVVVTHDPALVSALNLRRFALRGGRVEPE